MAEKGKERSDIVPDRRLLPRPSPTEYNERGWNLSRKSGKLGTVWISPARIPRGLKELESDIWNGLLLDR